MGRKHYSGKELLTMRKQDKQRRQLEAKIEAERITQVPYCWNGEVVKMIVGKRNGGRVQ